MKNTLIFIEMNVIINTNKNIKKIIYIDDIQLYPTISSFRLKCLLNCPFTQLKSKILYCFTTEINENFNF